MYLGTGEGGSMNNTVGTDHALAVVFPVPVVGGRVRLGIGRVISGRRRPTDRG